MARLSMSVARRGLLVLLAASLVACEVAYPLDDFVPRDELDAMSDAPDAPDAADVPDAPDVAPREDAVRDAAPLDCTAGKHLFCATFDRVPAVTSEWKGFFTPGGGTIALDTTTFTSPGSSFVSTLPSSTATEVAATVYQQVDAPVPDRLFRLELDVRLDVITYPTVVLLALVKRGTGGKGIGLAVGPSGLQLQINGSGVGPVTATIATGVWHHVRLDGVFATTTTGSVSLYVDDLGTPVLSRTSLQTATATSTETSLSLGLYSGPGSSPFIARFDDVAFDYP
jgi:hypothetical protein